MDHARRLNGEADVVRVVCGEDVDRQSGSDLHVRPRDVWSQGQDVQEGLTRLLLSIAEHSNMLDANRAQDIHQLGDTDVHRPLGEAVR